MNSRRRFIQAGAAAGVLGIVGWSNLVRAQNLELGKIISGFPAGGTVDVLARRVAERLRGGYARAVIVENKPGAAGQIGVATLKDSPPDGSVMLLTPSSMLSIYPYIFQKLQYRLEDVAPASLAAYINHGLAVGPAVPESVKTLKDFFAWSKVNADKASYGSPGAGSMPHLIGVLLAKASGTELRHIPYRGAQPGVQDLLGGPIASVLRPIGDFIPHVKARKPRVGALSRQARSAP